MALDPSPWLQYGTVSYWNYRIGSSVQAPPTPVPASAPPSGIDRALRPGLLLRLEGLALLVASVALYAHLGHGWWWFAAFVLAPDLGLLGYLAGSRVGAATYNLTHAAVLPALLGAYGVISGTDPVTAASLIWLAHVGVDRAVGYGLKYPVAFRETHLQRAD